MNPLCAHSPFIFMTTCHGMPWQAFLRSLPERLQHVRAKRIETENGKLSGGGHDPPGWRRRHADQHGNSHCLNDPGRSCFKRIDSIPAQSGDRNHLDRR